LLQLLLHGRSVLQSESDKSNVSHHVRVGLWSSTSFFVWILSATKL